MSNVDRATPKLVKPPRLRAGDRIGIVAPASPFSREEFDAGVDELGRLGFQAVFDDRVFARDGFVAGDPQTRAGHLLDLWRDPSVAGIICARGGYGSVQLLPLLDLAALASTPKVLVGYSDTTSLSSWLTGYGQLVTFHGPMIAGRLSRREAGYDRRSFVAALTMTDPMGRLAPAGLETIRSGEASGMLVGGTLTQLCASLGTPYAFDPAPGHVLFLDEVRERPYRLHRMLMQLRLAGLLTRASAIVFGELPDCDEPGTFTDGQGIRARDAISEALTDFTGPLLVGFPSGHTRGPSWTLPFGVRCTVIADARPALIIEEAAVV
jgi:muramoyltetrapeptide carboxypeptidase